MTASRPREAFSFLTTTVVVVGSYDEFGNPDILVKKKRNGAMGGFRRRIDTTHQLVGSLASPIC
jgi:hypothetical protein